MWSTAGMANVLSDDKQQQVLGLGRLGWSLRRIESATGVRRETAAGYLRTAGILVRGRGRPSTASPPKPAISEEVITDYSSEKSAGPNSNPAIAAEVSTDPPAISASACEPYRELIVEALARGQNARAIWQDLVDDHGFGARYASVQRFVRHLRGSQVPEARVVITTAPGEECQVDYGEGPMVRDKVSSKYRRTRLFVLTLGYSRKSVRLIVLKSSSRIWAELHEQAFRRLGGVPRRGA